MAKRRSSKAPEPIPAELMGEVLRGRIGAAEGYVQSGPYARWLDGRHIGQYTPRRVPISVLKIMREHPQLSLGLAAYRGPFFGIDYDVEGGTPETRAFVRKVFVDTPLLYRALETILNALDYGFQAHELIWGLEDVTFDPDGDGGAPPITLPLAAVILEANDIDPARVGIVVDEREKPIGYRIDGNAMQTIPIEKALHAVHQMEHRNWRGRSLLKRGYKPFWWSEFVGLFMCRWFERKSDPPYWGEAPSDPRPDPKDPTTMQYPTQYLRSALLDLRSSGVLITPREIDPETKQSKWNVRELTDGGRAETFVTGLQYLDAQMLRAITVPEEITTRGSVGSQAKTETVLAVFLQALETVKKTLVLRTLNAGVIEPLVRWNFGRSVAAPRMTAPDFNREQKELLGELLKLVLQVPLELGDGRKFRPLDMLNLDRLVALLNVPHRKAAEVARPPEAAPPPEGPDATEPANEAASESEPADEQEPTEPAQK